MLKSIKTNKRLLSLCKPQNQFSSFHLPTYITPCHANLLLENEGKRVKFIDFRDANLFKQQHLPNALNNDDQLPSMGEYWSLYNACKNVDILALRYELGLQELGINKGDIIIGYENSHFLTFNTQIMYYVTRYMGYDMVSILKGGFNGWVNKGFQTQQCKSMEEVYELQQCCKNGNFCAEKQKDQSIFTDKLSLLNLILSGQKNVKIIDARAPHEFKMGRVPGAINIPYQQLYIKSDEVGVCVKSQQRIEELLKNHGIDKDDKIIVYCQKGLRAQACFSALQSAGYWNTSNYIGSYYEWSNDLNLPVEM